MVVRRIKIGKRREFLYKLRFSMLMGRVISLELDSRFAAGLCADG
jgi:hypothetical protein